MLHVLAQVPRCSYLSISNIAAYSACATLHENQYNTTHYQYDSKVIAQLGSVFDYLFKASSFWFAIHDRFGPKEELRFTKTSTIVFLFKVGSQDVPTSLRSSLFKRIIPLQRVRWVRSITFFCKLCIIIASCEN